MCARCCQKLYPKTHTLILPDRVDFFFWSCRFEMTLRYQLGIVIFTRYAYNEPLLNEVITAGAVIEPG